MHIIVCMCLFLEVNNPDNVCVLFGIMRTVCFVKKYCVYV